MYLKNCNKVTTKKPNVVVCMCVCVHQGGCVHACVTVYACMCDYGMHSCACVCVCVCVLVD